MPLSAAVLALGYATTSATLSVVNKWALVGFPYSGTLTLAQFGFAAATVRLLSLCRVVEAEALEFALAARFFPAVAMFYASIACNMRLLTHATVDTFVVCRSLVPVMTQLGEVFVLHKPAPSAQAVVCLVTIAVGAVGFAAHNVDGVSATVVAWASLYICCISLDMLVVKRVVSKVELSRWGYVYYNNALALFLYPAWLCMTGEAVALRAVDVAVLKTSVGPVFVSCAIGLGISFFGLNARKALSPTAFTVLGAACKFLSIIINALCWSRHAPVEAVPWLCVALAGSLLYQQAHDIDQQKRPAAVTSSLRLDRHQTETPLPGGASHARRSTLASRASRGEDSVNQTALVPSLRSAA